MEYKDLTPMDKRGVYAQAFEKEIVALRAENEKLKERSQRDSKLTETLCSGTNLRSEYIQSLEEALREDASNLAACLSEVRRTARSYDWIRDGRGPYAYDDDEYRLEAGRGFGAIMDIAGKGLAVSGTLLNETLAAAASEPEEHGKTTG